ncbi:MAG: site-specific integrase [Anaerolineales bacterium]|jgi:hypothetical protein
MSRDALPQFVYSITKKAGVPNAYRHKLRHTFAITYLRSGGDVFTLQQILGHGSLDMVRYYARIAQSDIPQAHRKASPVDDWRPWKGWAGAENMAICEGARMPNQSHVSAIATSPYTRDRAIRVACAEA